MGVELAAGPEPKVSLAKVMLYYMFYALKFFHCLLSALIPRLSDGVPPLGIHPGTRGVGNFTLPGAVRSPHRGRAPPVKSKLKGGHLGSWIATKDPSLTGPRITFSIEIALNF